MANGAIVIAAAAALVVAGGVAAYVVVDGDGEPPTAEVVTPIVVSRNGALGWWDGTRWHDVQGVEPVLPFEAGDVFSLVGVGVDPVDAVALPASPEPYCEFQGSFTVPLDPPLDVDGGRPVAVLASWDVTPRPVEALDPASPVYRDAVVAALGDLGIEDAVVVVQQLLRVDLDGDGVDEVLVTAVHPEQVAGVSPRAGWFSVVLLRQVVDERPVTTPIAVTAFTEDNPDNYPTQATHSVEAVADVSGDGVMEVVIHSSFFESTSSEVFELLDDDPGAKRVLGGGCGA